MILTLSAVSLNDKALSLPITARFDAQGGSIGRADHCTLALPDPERFISRKQAEVVFVGEGFVIRNVGAANPVVVGSHALANGESTALRDGDEVRLGGYLLRAELKAGASHARAAAAPAPPPPFKSAAPVTRPPSAPPQQSPPAYQPPPAPALSASNPFADLLSPSANHSDPFAGLLTPGPAAAATAPADPFAGLMAAPAGLSGDSQAVTPAPPAAALLPEDFDPFSPIAQAPPRHSALGTAHASPVAAPAPSDDPFAGLIPAPGAAASIDDAFGLSAGPGQDALAHFSGDLGRPAVAQPGGLSTDPLALFGGASAAAADWALPAAAPALADHFSPPRVAPPAMAAVPNMVAPVAGYPGDVEAQLWQAFCEGAGVRLALPVGSGPERFRTLGQVTRSAIEGTLQLMAVRASTKHEMRAAVTQIQARSNNPLKFAPDAKVAIEQLLQPPARGFLDGPAAMDDAMQDLVGHAIASVAGMRAAIEGMLDRFDPQALEAQLASGSMLENLLALNRRSRLWELYLQHHRAIREEAQEDFHKLFGKAFVAAYEQQVDRLKKKGSA